MPDLIWEIDDQDGVFLTFDDGPTPGVTEWILSTLDKYDAKATFFVLGKNVEMYPDLYQRILDAGHRVGNHTYSHQKGWGMSLERYTEDVDFANDFIHSELFRPPYARITPAQARLLGQRYKQVSKEVKNYFKGEYGIAPAPVSKELETQILGEGGKPVDCRIEDAKRTGEDFKKAKEALGDLARSEEDIMSYICYPDQTMKFLADRKAKEENICKYSIVEA